MSASFAQQAPGEYRPWERSVLPNVSDYGGVGALQTPTARFGKDGQFLAGISIASPYHRYFINLQALPWLEGTFRYTRITDRAYSNVAGFSDQDYKDRSVDVKIRLSEEGENWPEIAIGARDLGGTNLFGSEYIVASKRFGNVDVTAGLGFGALGSRAHFDNPLGQFIDRFKNRGDGADAAGGLGTAFFSGPMALFGSLSYRWEDIPLINDDLLFIIEYDSNNYKDDPAASDLTPKSPFNVGITYQPSSWVQLSAGFERGDTAMARVSLFADFNNGFNPLLDKGVPPEIAIRGRNGPQGRPDALPIEPRPAEAAWLPELAEASVRAAAADRALEVRRFDVSETHAEIDLTGGMPGWEMNDALLVAAQAARAVPTTVDIVEVRLLGQSGRRVMSWRLPRKDMAAEDLQLDTTTVDAQDIAAQASAGVHMAHVQTHQDQKEIALRLFTAAAKNDVVLDRMEIAGDTVRIHIGNMPFRNFITSAGRAARVATQVMPPEVERFTLVLGEDGLDVAELTVLRTHLERLSKDQSTLDELWHQIDIRQARPPGDDAIVNGDRFPAFDWSIAPRLRQQVGGPDNFFLYQVYLRALASVRPTPNTEIDGYVGLNIVNNYDELTLESDSQLPRVRSDIKEYLKQGETWIGRLQGAYYGTVAPGIYATAYAGLLEEMFGGVGGEVLYKSVGSPWAFGLDVNWVKQRDFDGMLGFSDYSTVTGHLGAYYDLPFWDLHGSVRAGRYLAKDWGATFELAREFESGIRAGVFATVTDVSAEEFGEGSFDKGFFLSVPLDLYATKPTKTRFGITYRPVTRDGGQQLNRSSALIGRVDSYDVNGVARNWPGLMD
ncbi:YjbH domain-containing protein [Tistrella bauzanensis]|uniref:YjbH domain-containing protein n=1 Tax=Tistrella bauzanensis TaxID=657419 RepID=UPI00166400E9|nr:YjbH domain-containing protein [Tistrella bauzanensis]